MQSYSYSMLQLCWATLSFTSTAQLKALSITKIPRYYIILYIDIYIYVYIYCILLHIMCVYMYIYICIYILHITAYHVYICIYIYIQYIYIPFRLSSPSCPGSLHKNCVQPVGCSFESKRHKTMPYAQRSGNLQMNLTSQIYPLLTSCAASSGDHSKRRHCVQRIGQAALPKVSTRCLDRFGNSWSKSWALTSWR